MSSKLPQMFNTIKTMDCAESGYRELRGYPCCSSHIGKRAKRYRATLPAMVNANARRSQKTCFLQALNNFTKDDLSIVLTFRSDVEDKERVLLAKNMIKRMQRKYKKEGKTIKYMLFWGRGDENGNLHLHIILNIMEETKFDQLKKTMIDKSGLINIHIQKIGERWGIGSTDYEIIKVAIIYLYNQWFSLTDEDKTITKMNKAHWRSSRTLNKVEVTESYDDDETEQPFDKSPYEQLNTYWRAWQKGVDEFINRVQEINVGYRVIGFGYHNGQCPFYVDDYGDVFFKIELAKVGSKIDNGNYSIVKKYKSGNIIRCFLIDTLTGEVMREDRVDASKNAKIA